MTAGSTAHEPVPADCTAPTCGEARGARMPPLTPRRRRRHRRHRRRRWPVGETVLRAWVPSVSPSASSRRVGRGRSPRG
eukprot:gene12997-biopygen15544